MRSDVDEGARRTGAGRTATDGAAYHRDVIFQAWGCIIGDQRIIYLSGPITTGLRWIAALEQQPSPSLGEVINENIQALKEAAAILRKTVSGIILQPGGLTVQGWSQEDYLELWTKLIERHAGEVRFLPDWSYSIGCANEFARAALNNIILRTVEGELIAPEDGLKAIEGAAADLKDRSARTQRLELLSQSLAGVAQQLRCSLATSKIAAA